MKYLFILFGFSAQAETTIGFTLLNSLQRTDQGYRAYIGFDKKLDKEININMFLQKERMDVSGENTYFKVGPRYNNLYIFIESIDYKSTFGTLNKYYDKRLGISYEIKIP